MTPRAHTSAWGRRGFAMPVVVLLSLIVGVMAAVLLERQSTQRLVVERQLRGYRDHHFQRGLREVVGAWTDQLIGQPLEKLIAEDGHALDLELPGGGLAAVYLFDGQGTVLTDPMGLTTEEQQDALGIIEALAQISGEQADPAWFRPVGPLKICVATAPPEVLEAMAAYAGAKSPRRFAQTLVETRQRQDLTEADLQTAQNLAEIGAADRQVMTRIATVRPELWAMIVDFYDPVQPASDGGPTARFGARFVLPVGGGGRSATTLQSLGRFLSWEELPIR